MENKAIIEEGKKRFQQLLEYTVGYNKPFLEADDEQPQDQPQGGAPDMGGGAPMGGPDMGGGAPMGGPDMGGGAPMGGPDMGGGAPMGGPDMGGGMPQGGGAPMGGNMQQGQAQPPEGFNPQEPMDDGMSQGDMSDADFQAGPDDDVIDVSELTDAQESTEDAVKEVGDKFDKVLKYLGQWEEMIKSNNEKIEDLKAEMEKRNPTQLEKLSMQTAHSYPFNVTPDEYWKEKEATSNYRTEDDENGKEQGQYTITKNDIDGNTNWKSISDSLDDDAIYHPTLKNTMGYGL